MTVNALAASMRRNRGLPRVWRNSAIRMRSAQIELAKQRPKIEKDRRVQQRLGLGRAHPGCELLLPFLGVRHSAGLLAMIFPSKEGSRSDQDRRSRRARDLEQAQLRVARDP